MRSQLLSVAVLSVLLSAAPVQAATTTTTELANVVSLGSGDYSYSITGWAGGGTVSGTFAGLDGNTDGQLSFFNGEVSGFTMSYSGGSIVGATGFSFADLFGLVYDLDGGPLGDSLLLDIEGIGATSGTGSFRFGPGPVALCDGRAECGIIEGPAASVPEPSALVLALMGFGILVSTRRRRAG